MQEPAFAPRDFIAGKAARTLAEELLAMTQAEFSAVFRGSPMKRAKLRGVKRNAAVVREHAAWALQRLTLPNVYTAPDIA